MKKLFFAVALFVFASVFAKSAQASTCYLYFPPPWSSICQIIGPTPPANTRAGYNSAPTLASNEVAAFTNSNGTGGGGFWVVFHAPLYYSPLGDWDSASWQVNSVKCGSAAHAIFYSDSTYSTAVGSCSPGQTVQNTNSWSVSSLHAF